MLSLVLGACGARGADDGDDAPRPAREEMFARPLEIYDELGFFTGSGAFPVVASVATLAGPADSSYFMLALSVPNAALRFQRDGAGFFAEYTLDVTFMDRDSAIVKRFATREAVRIPTFGETGRTDESIVFQHGIAVPPGRYIVRVQAADAHSSRGFRVTDTLTVPSYASGPGIASPILVYRADGRTDRAALPDLIVNPRHTVPYGGDAPLVYLESYGRGAAPVTVRVLGADGTTLWSANAALPNGNDTLRYGVIEIPAETLPLGRFWLEVAEPGIAPLRTPIVMTISDQWMVSNFDDVIEFLNFIAFPSELDSLRVGTAAARRDAWERFWKRRDPLPITDVNEFRDEFFERVRYATEAFREPGGSAGWATDRGEVYIVLGPPDHSVERYIGDRDMRMQPNGEEWLYTNVPGGRLTLLFYDRNGFGRYELIPSSAAAFRSVADRMKRAPQSR